MSHDDRVLYQAEMRYMSAAEKAIKNIRVNDTFAGSVEKVMNQCT